MVSILDGNARSDNNTHFPPEAFDSFDVETEWSGILKEKKGFTRRQNGDQLKVNL